MKTKLLPAAIIASAATAFIAPSAHAQYAAGDLLLGFESFSNGTLGANNYIVDLGPASYFLTLAATPGTNINLTTSDANYSPAGLGSIGADLSTSSGFGAAWYNNSNSANNNVQWGVIGATNKNGGDFGLPASTLFETVADGSNAPAAYDTSAQTGNYNKINNLGNLFNGDYGTSNSNVADFEASLNDRHLELLPSEHHGGVRNSRHRTGGFGHRHRTDELGSRSVRTGAHGRGRQCVWKGTGQFHPGQFRRPVFHHRRPGAFHLCDHRPWRSLAPVFPQNPQAPRSINHQPANTTNQQTKNPSLIERTLK